MWVCFWVLWKWLLQHLNTEGTQEFNYPLVVVDLQGSYTERTVVCTLNVAQVTMTGRSGLNRLAGLFIELSAFSPDPIFQPDCKMQVRGRVQLMINIHHSDDEGLKRRSEVMPKYCTRSNRY